MWPVGYFALQLDKIASCKHDEFLYTRHFLKRTSDLELLDEVLIRIIACICQCIKCVLPWFEYASFLNMCFRRH